MLLPFHPDRQASCGELSPGEGSMCGDRGLVPAPSQVKEPEFYPRQLDNVEKAPVDANIRQQGLTANELHCL